MMCPTRPLLLYHGGKWRLAPWIVSHFPDHKIYAEPFGGAASVLLRKPPSYCEVYNDLDDDIVNLFHVVRKYGAAFKNALRSTPFSRTEYKKAWQFTIAPFERARRTIIRSAMGYNPAATTRVGGNSKEKTGFRCSPCLNRGTRHIEDFNTYVDALDGIILRLKDVIIENRDAPIILEKYDAPYTLFYLDPPYVTATRDKGDDYRYEMTDNDHRELATIVRALKGKVIISGYESALYNELYPDWRREERIAIADHGVKKKEILWLNFDRVETKTLENQGRLFTS